MTNQHAIRLIDDPPQRGSWNMSVDQALLETADQKGLITLRFYRWDPPTLSLGYFQNASERATHTASSLCEVVRRASGGGAIMHHHELTYSLCIPSGSRWSKENSMLYDVVHESIVAYLQSLGLSAELFTKSKSEATQKQPFLCFERRASGDIVLDGNKVGGSAQRRLKKAVLQHGSILFQASEFAPELPGIDDLSQLPTSSYDALKMAISQAISAKLKLPIVPGGLDEDEIDAAQKIEFEKFSNDIWTLNR